MIKKLLSLLLLPVFIVGSMSADEIASLSDQDRYLSLVEMADKACDDGKWADAEISLQQAVAEFPNHSGNAMLLSNLGMIRYNLGKDSLAIQTLTEALAKAPVSVTILLNRAKILTATGKDSEALRDYERVMSLDSTITKARLNHGLIALRNKKFKDAKVDFDYLDTRYPQAEDTQIGMATFLSSVGKYEESIPYYTRLIADHKMEEFYGARAFSQIFSGRLSEASEDLATAITINPTDGELYLYRAMLNKMRFRPADAKADALKAIELGVAQHRVKQFLK